MTEKPAKGSLLVIFLTVFIDLLGFGMVLPLLPIYAQEFTADPAGVKLGLLMASFSAMQFIFAPLWGRLERSSCFYDYWISKVGVISSRWMQTRIARWRCSWC